MGIVWLGVLVWCGIFVPDGWALQAGATRLALEIPDGTPLGGHVHRLGRGSVGTHDAITVRALYLEDGDTRIALVTADVHSITPELRARVLELAPAGIADTNIILTATHTHSGPGGLSRSWFARRYLGGYMEETVNVVAQGIADTLADAMATKKRATIGYKVRSGGRLTENMFEQGGIRDAQVGVIRVDDSDGNPIAIVGSMSAHPTTAPVSAGLVFSADYPGYFCDHLESLSHGDTVAFFLNGATGDQACTNRENKGDWDWPAYIGEELAVSVKSIANGIDCQELPILINYRTGEVPAHLAGPFLPREVLVQTLEIDRLLVSFLPGEPYAGVQEDLSRIAKKRGYSAHITVGLANDYVMDIASPDAAAERGDAPGLNVLGPEGMDWAVDIVQGLMRRGDYRSPAVVEVRGVNPASIPGGYRVTLAGDDATRIRRQGATMAFLLEDAWRRSVLTGLRDGGGAVDLPLWGDRVGLDSTPIALPVLADRERGRLSDEEEQHVRWFAQGAREPFDKIQLLQRYTGEAIVPAVIAIGGDGAGEDGPLMGYIAAVTEGTPIVVYQNRPEEGRGSIGVGLPWDTRLRIGLSGKRMLNAGESLNADELGEGIQIEMGESNFEEPELNSEVVSRGQLEKVLAGMGVQRLTDSEGDAMPVVFAVILEPKTGSVYLAVSEGELFSGEFQRFSAAEDSR